MNDRDLDNYITGNFGQDQFPDKCECEKCQETNNSDDLIEATSRKMICASCSDDLDICDCCDKPIDTEQSWDNESCDSCNESKGDKDFDMER